MFKRLAFLVSVAVFGSSCIKSTPVTPSPLNPDQSAQLEQAILGTCDVIATQKEGGSERSDPGGLSFTFGQEGMAGYNALGVQLNYKYQLQGRNVVTSGPYETMRVDDWSGGTLRFFVYQLSTTYVCKKRG